MPYLLPNPNPDPNPNVNLNSALGSVTVQFNPYLVIEHPIIRCVLMGYYIVGRLCGNTPL